MAAETREALLPTAGSIATTGPAPAGLAEALPGLDVERPHSSSVASVVHSHALGVRGNGKLSVGSVARQV